MVLLRKKKTWFRPDSDIVLQGHISFYTNLLYETTREQPFV